ncbi:MAG: hypothetical protein Aureis2KO_26580 [Aureisphaera sp.]
MLQQLFTIAFVFTSFIAFSQKSITVGKTQERIVIDGVLNEVTWSQVEATDEFLNQWPNDEGVAQVQTEVKLAFDEDFLYVGIICFDISNDHIIQTLKRDKDDEHFGSDGIAIVLDPFNQKTNGFFFGVNAGGAQFEGLISVSGNESFINENWDNKWFSEITYGQNMWYVEMAIPFRTLRYDSSNTTWGLNFVRNDMKNNYFSSWNRVPLNFNTINLGYTGEMTWPENPPKVKKGKINVLPYVLGSANRDFENSEKADYGLDFGVDAKVGLGPALNLDLTVNPDFSTVDVDQQQINLTRFPLFFPERRGFFLENSDLFNSFGIGSINPFFSRRIGLNVPINFGARLSGNLNKKLRIGVMDIQTGSEDGINPQNYFVSSLSQRIGNRSTLDAMLVNRQATSSKENPSENAYNRVFAMEYNFVDSKGKWSANVGGHKSFNPGDLDEEAYFTSTLRFQTKRLLTRVSGHRVGQNYLTDVGFVPRLENYDAASDTIVRKGFYQLAYLLVYDFFPQKESSPINLHGPRISTTSILNIDGSLNAMFAGLFYFVNFKNQSALEVKFTQDRDNLPFDSFIVGDIPFPKDDYTYNRYGFWYRFNPRKKFSGRMGATHGEFFNGKRTFFEAEANYRIQPWGNFSLNYNYNDVNLPENLDSQDFHLAGLTSEISFSNKMFWTTFVQYNTQNDNVNINSRFQWRYAPMSDLFIVYSDNYYPETLNSKNRGLVLKLAYWF